MNQQESWAVIFDWDGVILDSSGPHEESWNALAADQGLDLPHDHFERGFGLKSEAIISTILGWTRDPERLRELTDRKEHLYREIMRRDGARALPGVFAWLDQLTRHQVPCAVGSSTSLENIDCVSGLLGLADRFDAVVTAEDVKVGKPHPDVFLLGASRLGVDPARCVVFEDAPAGIEAALAAGMVAIGVVGTHGRDGLQRAHQVVDRMDALDVVSLRRHVLERQPDRI